MDKKILNFIKDNIDSEFNFLLKSHGDISVLRKNSKIFIDDELVNNQRYANKFFIRVNQNLSKDGFYVGKFISNSRRKKKIKEIYPRYLYKTIIFFDILIHRIIPKLRIFEKIYFYVTKGKNRSFSKAEVFGRLYYCGFKIISEQKFGIFNYFICKKYTNPEKSKTPSYRFLIKLERVGLNGKIFNAYKLRTMHPYSEYLQKYIYEKHSLMKSGKIKNDFRISSFAKFLRRYWIDEIPMIYNLLKGDIKLFGVRPISKQYYEMYPDDLKKIRIKNKPGFIPPFYADMPKSFDEIIDSEFNYLKKHNINPIYTDLTYLTRALKNVIIRGIRSS